MLDPFPLGPPAALVQLVQPLANYAHLPSLALHAHEVLLFATAYQLMQSYFAPWISAQLFPKTYATLSRRTRLNWDVHVVSLVQSVLVCGLAVWVMRADGQRAAMDWEERVWGYTGSLGLVQALGCGYFLWDLWISLVHIDMFGWGFLAHAVSALAVFVLGFRPFVNYYAPTFILYELSSPFLNIHWFLDKLSLTGSNIQLANGILLLSSFFGCRLVWGTIQSVRVYWDVIRAFRQGAIIPAGSKLFDVTARLSAAEDSVRFATFRQDVPLWLAASYLASNITLNGLNWYWFGEMIKAIRKRFDPPFGTRGLPERLPKRGGMLEGVDPSAPEKKVIKKETEIWKGVDADGSTSVEVDQTEVRRRVPKVEESDEDVELVP